MENLILELFRREREDVMRLMDERFRLHSELPGAHPHSHVHDEAAISAIVERHLAAMADEIEKVSEPEPEPEPEPEVSPERFHPLHHRVGGRR